MAEFLIYNMTHWFDLPSNLEPGKTGYERHSDIIQAKPIDIAEKEDQIAKLAEKYNARSIIGDIVEVRPDGFGMCGLEPDSFVLIKVPGLDIETAKQYTGSLKDGEVLLRKFRFNIDISGLSFVNGEATVTLKDLQDSMTIKEN